MCTYCFPGSSPMYLNLLQRCSCLVRYDAVAPVYQHYVALTTTVSGANASTVRVGGAGVWSREFGFRQLSAESLLLLPLPGMLGMLAGACGALLAHWDGSVGLSLLLFDRH